MEGRRLPGWPAREPGSLCPSRPTPAPAPVTHTHPATWRCLSKKAKPRNASSRVGWAAGACIAPNATFGEPGLVKEAATRKPGGRGLPLLRPTARETHVDETPNCRVHATMHTVTLCLTCAVYVLSTEYRREGACSSCLSRPSRVVERGQPRLSHEHGICRATGRRSFRLGMGDGGIGYGQSSLTTHGYGAFPSRAHMSLSTPLPSSQEDLRCPGLLTPGITTLSRETGKERRPLPLTGLAASRARASALSLTGASGWGGCCRAGLGIAQ